MIIFFLRTFYEPLDNIPVLLIDTNEVFIKINNIENNPDINTFLLDQNHKILLRGNPINNGRVFDLYKEKIISLK